MICPRLVNIAMESDVFPYRNYHHICLSSWWAWCGKYSPRWYVPNSLISWWKMTYFLIGLVTMYHVCLSSRWSWCGKYSPRRHVLSSSMSQWKVTYFLIEVFTICISINISIDISMYTSTDMTTHLWTHPSICHWYINGYRQRLLNGCMHRRMHKFIMCPLISQGICALMCVYIQKCIHW